MAKLLSSGVNGFLVSVRKVAGQINEWFVSGFAGRGWKIWEHMPGRFKLEIDDAVFRGTLTVYEFLISKIRSLVGALTISNAHGKIKSVDGDSDPENYLITLEEENSFVADDFIRMEEWTGNRRHYWVKVLEIKGENVVIPKSEFEGMSAPESGDEIVQFGNETNPARQAALYLHVDEGGSPAIDLMRGINSKSFEGKVKARFGGSIPGSPDEYNGLYAENGTLVFTDGEGKITSRLWPDGTAELGAGSFMAKPNKSGYIGGENGLKWHWDTAKNKFICTFGSDAVLQWDNLSEESKENLKGKPGDKGDSPVVGENGNWWIGSTDTGVKAEGEDGSSPVIGQNGNWWINDVDTGVKAKGEDANLLDWVEEWNNNQTQIGDEFFVSPKMFSGTKSEDGKLTGIAMGRDCIEIDGVKHTGIFAIVDGQIVFELDPITKVYKFTGEVHATSGTFKSESGTQNISIDSGRLVMVNEYNVESFAMRMRYFTATGYAKALCADIAAFLPDKYYLDSFNPSQLFHDGHGYVRYYDTSIPQTIGFGLDVVYAGVVSSAGSLLKVKVYDRRSIVSVERLSMGRYQVSMFNTPFNSANDYTVFAAGEKVNDDRNVGTFASIYDKTPTGFKIYIGDDDSPNDAAFSFQVVSTMDWN